MWLFAATVVKRVHLSTSISLPLAAFFMWLVRLAYLSLEADFTNAAVVYGALDALTPLSIIAGAICLFETMEATRVRLMNSKFQNNVVEHVLGSPAVNTFFDNSGTRLAARGWRLRT